MLVGAFGLAARLHDRMDVEVLISSEDRDNFIKNMLTIRAEERTALAVRVPDAFVYIDDLGGRLQRITNPPRDRREPMG